MAERESVVTLFDCPLLGDRVTCRLTYASFLGGQARRLIAFDCDGKNRCSVATRRNDGGYTYTWSRCVHPVAGSSSPDA